LLVDRIVLCLFVFFAANTIAVAQFKEVGPPPISAAAARQQFRMLLDNADPGNRQETIRTISGLLPWYRDLADEEITAAWQRDGRANLPEVIEPLADAHLATAIVESSWRRQRQATFNAAYAPLLGHLMLRYPESAKPFLDDLLGPAASGQPMPDLSPAEAETVCQILVDMPTDIGTWKRNAMQILPHYRRAAETVLDREVRGGDQEKSYQAQLWLKDLKLNVPDLPRDRQTSGRQTSDRPSAPPGRRLAVSSADTPGPIPGGPPAPADAGASQGPTNAPLRAPSGSAAARPSSMPKSGVLECMGSPVPQNAEYVFRNLPPAKLQLDYDTKTWDARLTPGEGQTQKLVLRNKSSGPQKRCEVHWSVIP
jgi:hypothetical protein